MDESEKTVISHQLEWGGKKADSEIGERDDDVDANNRA